MEEKNFGYFVLCNDWVGDEAMYYETEEKARKAVTDFIFKDYNNGDDGATYFIFKGEKIAQANLPERPQIIWS